jgi:hypothetical protein
MNRFISAFLSLAVTLATSAALYARSDTAASSLVKDIADVSLDASRRQESAQELRRRLIEQPDLAPAVLDEIRTVAKKDQDTQAKELSYSILGVLNDEEAVDLLRAAAIEKAKPYDLRAHAIQNLATHPLSGKAKPAIVATLSAILEENDVAIKVRAASGLEADWCQA